MSVLSGLKYERVYELFMGTNKTVRDKHMSVLSGCPQSRVPMYIIIRHHFTPENSWPLYPLIKMPLTIPTESVFVMHTLISTNAPIHEIESYDVSHLLILFPSLPSLV